MKRIFLGLAAALALFLGANFNAASAATILDPNPVASINVQGQFDHPGIGSYLVGYQFQLTKNADLTSNTITTTNLAFSLAVYDSADQLVSFTNLLANALYTLVVSGSSGSGHSEFSGDVFFTASNVPVPPALLLFATTLVGLGAVAYRRRKMMPTA